MIDGVPHEVSEEKEDQFLKDNKHRNPVLKSDGLTKSNQGTILSQNKQKLQINKDLGINLETGEIVKNTDSNLEDGSLDPELIKEDPSKEEISEKYNTLFEDLLSQIETRQNNKFVPSIESIDPKLQEYKSQIDNIDTEIKSLNDAEYRTQEEYDDYVKKFEILNKQRKNIVNDHNVDLEIYNKAVQGELDEYNLQSENLINKYDSTVNDYYQERFGVDAPTEPPSYTIANKDLSNQVEKSREEMIEMFDNPSFVKQLKDGEINVNVKNDPEINEYMSGLFNLDKLNEYKERYNRTHKNKKESRFSDYMVHGQDVKIEVQDIDDFERDFPNAKPITLHDRVRRIQNDKSISDKEKVDLIEKAYTTPKQLGEMKDWQERFLHVKNNPELYHDKVGIHEKLTSWYPDWMVVWGAGLANQTTELFLEGPIKALESEKLAKGIIEGKTREEMMESGELTDLRAFDIVQKELQKFATKHYDKEGNEMNIVDLIEKGEHWKAGGLAGEQAFSSIYSVIISGANPFVGAAVLGTGVYGTEYTEAVTERFKPSELDEETMNSIRKNSAIHAGGEFVGEYFGGVLFRHAAGLRKSGVTKEVIKEFNRGFINRGVRGFVGGGVSEFLAEGMTSGIQQAADKWIYGDDITFRNGVRQVINDGLIGMMMGGPVAGITRAAGGVDAQHAQQMLAGHKWRSDFSKLNSKLTRAKEDLQKASDKLKPLHQKRVNTIKKQIEQKKKELNSIYENKTEAELLERAETLDERNKQIDIAFNDKNSEETRKEARDRINQLNAKLDHETNGFINAEFEQVVGDFLKGREILDKRGATWGFGSDLKVKRLKTQKQIDDAIKKIKEETGQDVSGVEGIFMDGKNKTIYINEQRAAEVGALNVYAHELLHYVMSRNFKTDNENMKPLVSALKDYLVQSGNEKAIERIEQRMRDNGYMDENGQLKEGRLEEYFEMLSDLMDKKQVKLDKNKTGSLVKSFNDFVIGLGFKKVKLGDGEAIFDFIQTFSKNINRSGLLGELTKRRITRVELETDIEGVEKADAKTTKPGKIISTKGFKANLTQKKEYWMTKNHAGEDVRVVVKYKADGTVEVSYQQKYDGTWTTYNNDKINKEFQEKHGENFVQEWVKTAINDEVDIKDIRNIETITDVNKLYSQRAIEKHGLIREAETTIKESKSQNPELDRLGKGFTNETWESEGYDRAMNAIKKDEFVRNIIRNKYKAPSKIPATFVDDVIGSVPFQNMVKRFNKGKWGTKNENESLFGYINSQMEFRAGDVFAEFKDQIQGKKVEADAVTTEGQQRVQFEDTTYDLDKITDRINYWDNVTKSEDPKRVDNQSKFRTNIGLLDKDASKADIQKSEIFRKVQTGLAGIDLSKFGNKKEFLAAYNKIMADALESTMGRQFADNADFKKYRNDILAEIPLATLIKMQAQLPTKDNNGKPFGNIFIKNHGRQSSQEILNDFMYGLNKTGKNPRNKKLLPEMKELWEKGAKGLKAADAKKNPEGAEYYRKKGAGVTIYERLNIKTEQWDSYIDGNFKGKRQVVDKSGTKGNNRTKILRESAVAIAKDATPEALTNEFLEKFIGMKKAEGAITTKDIKDFVLETIQKPPTLKFSETKQAESFERVDDYLNNFIQAEFHGEGIKGRNPLLKDHNLSEYNWKVKDKKDIPRIVKGIEQIILPLLPRECWFGPGSGSVFTHSAGREFGLKSTDRLYKKLKKEILKLKDLPSSSFGKSIPGLSKADHKTIWSLRNFYSKIRENPETFKSKIPEIKEFNRKVMAIHRALWIRIDESINGVKGDKNNATEIMGYLSLVGNDMGHWHKIGAEIIAYSTKINNYIDNNGVNQKARFEMEHAMVSTQAYLYLVNASLSDGVPFEATYDLVIDNYKLIALDKAMEIKLTKAITPSGKSLQKRMMDDFNLMTDRFHTRYANEIVGAIDGGINFETINMVSDGRTMGETFNINSDGKPVIIKKSQSEAKNINNAKKAQNNTIKFSKSGKSNGMSTFDFDETLIIDGENFVVATNPETGEKVNIKSGQWPTKGPELAAKGYKFNFDDFVNVRGGVDGPLLEKMRNQIKKYGSENVFVLTARPQNADVAIQGWLKSKGINIPFKNITGLARSEGQAKADWMLEKFAEGYNDMYFVDDALPNVKAVKNVLEQLDIKSKVVQAKIKFSKSAPLDFDKILEQTKGVAAGKRFSVAEARKRGISKGRFTFFIPPSAEDFKGLLYSFLGKGKEGDAHMKFFKDNLLDPYAKGYREWNIYKQAMADDYTALKKQFPGISKILNNKVKGTSFTNDSAVRVYLWDKAGFEIPGISKTLQDKLIKQVNSNPELKQFAEGLSVVSRRSEGYVKPDSYWIAQTISSDLNNIVNRVARKEFLSEWINNKDIIFNADNLNKIEAIYGSGFRDALENILYRMENGTNRIVGKDKITNKFLNWINGSVGATMFFNIRSSVLQTISTVNFINWGDNNIFKASVAFANQIQFWKDFAFIFNSPMLKQRRAGLQIDISASELTRAFADGRSKPEAIIAYLLEKGFTPTKIADSFAIAMGGSTFYRNRLNTYLKQGMSEAKAKEQAWLDFQEIAEETQQSSRPDLISMQQAGVLGRIILAWQNTPMQMTRLTKKAISDLVNRRGSDKANISRIIYYGVVQNIIFGALQTGLMFMLFGNDEDEEKKKKLELRVANGALDTLLRGTGVYGAAIAALKNVLMKWKEETEKPLWKRDDMNIAQEAISLSPPIGSKLRKLMQAVRTEKWNKGVSKEIGLRIENPNISIAANWTEAFTNIPIARTINKMNNVEEALTGNHEMWQRVALVSGWSQWSVGVKDEELEQAKDDAKEARRIKKKELKVKEKEEEKKVKEEDKKKVEEKKKEEGIKKVRCSGIKSNGQRCSIMIETKAKSVKCMYHKTYTKEEEKKGTDRDNDGIKEFRCTATTGSGKRCKNRTENKNKKCYAHQ